MISLDEQIALLHAAHGCQLDVDSREAILLSLRRLKRIEELMREPSEEMLDLGRDAGDFHILHYDGTDKPGTPRYSLRKSWEAMSAALLKQVEEEVK